VTPRLRQCGNPACRICAYNVPGEVPDSGHQDTLAELLLATAAVIIFGIAAIVLWPLVAS
jgi:hypothetical protein